MSATADGLLRALLALTGNPHLEPARNALLRSTSNADLIKLVGQSVTRDISRDGLEEILLKICDVIERGETSQTQRDNNAGLVQGIEGQTDDAATIGAEGRGSRSATLPISGIRELNFLDARPKRKLVEPNMMDVPRKKRRRSHALAPRTSSEIDILEEVGQDRTQQSPSPREASSDEMELDRISQLLSQSTDYDEDEGLENEVTQEMVDAVLWAVISASEKGPYLLTSPTPSQPKSE